MWTQKQILKNIATFPSNSNGSIMTLLLNSFMTEAVLT